MSSTYTSLGLAKVGSMDVDYLIKHNLNMDTINALLVGLAAGDIAANLEALADFAARLDNISNDGLAQSQASEGTQILLYSGTPKTAGEPSFQMGLTSFDYSGTYDQYFGMGFNLGAYSPFTGGTADKPSWGMAFEYNFVDEGHNTSEWYINYESPDGTSVVNFRPFYCSVRRDDNTSHQSYIRMDMGDTDGAFQVWARAVDAVNPYLQITSAATTINNATAINGGVAIKRTGAQSYITLGDNASGTYPNIIMKTGASHYNFLVAAQTKGSGFEITPSSATEGTTFTTPAIFVAGATGRVGINGILSPATTLHVAGDITKASATKNTGGGFVRALAEGASAALSGTNVTITLARATSGSRIPAGARLAAVQLRVDTTVTSGDGATSWSAAFSGGSSTSIMTDGTFTKNDKFNVMLAGNEITSALTDIVVSAVGGTFSGGVIRAICYYEDLSALSNNP